MKVPAKCKICSKPLVLEIDDDYAEVGDPNNLIPMATCNKCFDIREDILKYQKFILNWCSRVMTVPQKGRQQKLETCRQAIYSSSKKFCAAVARSHNANSDLWSVDIVDLLVDNPDRAGAILGKFRHEFPKMLISQQTH